MHCYLHSVAFSTPQPFPFPREVSNSLITLFISILTADLASRSSPRKLYHTAPTFYQALFRWYGVMLTVLPAHNSQKMCLRGSAVPPTRHQEHIPSREERKVEKALVSYDSHGEKRCLGTVLNPELERIRNKHTILASTGCTRDFCQSGRMTHTDEPRGT